MSYKNSFESVLGASSSASFIFRPPTYFKGARAAGPLEYWQSGAYGIITITDGIGQSYLWIQSTVHDGPALADGNVMLTYT